MRLLEHPVTSAFGVTTIGLFTLLAPLASSTHKELYHLSAPIKTILIPVLINFAGVFLIFAVLLSLGRRRPWIDRLLWTGIAVFLPWLLMKDWYSVRSVDVPLKVDLSYLFVVSVVAVAVLGRGTRRELLRRRARTLGATLLGFVALCGVLILIQGLLFCWQIRHLNRSDQLQTKLPLVMGSPLPTRGRILWIVLDELSFQQVYEKRYPGLELPAFDRLAAESTLFTQIVPAGDETEIVLPALLSGLSITEIRPFSSGQVLIVKDKRTGEWQPFDPHQTVFEDALKAGYKTGIAGWFNPYCRLLSGVLDSCFWMSQSTFPGGMISGQSIRWNAEQPIFYRFLAAARLMHLIGEQKTETANTVAHRQAYKDLVAESDKLLADTSMTFLLLHMPIPHPGGIYNRKTGTFANRQPTYLDNLALCDVYLSRVRQELEQTGSWDRTTIVLMGDHSWRVQRLWANKPEWTEEEQIASDGGRFDDRPAYVVKLADQHEGALITAPFEAVRTRALLDELLARRITTPKQLADWAHPAN